MSTGSAAVAARVEKRASDSNAFKVFLKQYFYLCMGLVMTALIVAGFSRTVDKSLFHANPPRPLLLWMHGAAFSAWMLLYLVQSALVRTRKISVHRFLGWFGAGLAALMVGLGLTIAVVMTHFDMGVLHQKGVDAFLAIPIEDMLVFGTCMALAVYWRKKPEYHRRLVFIATCQLMDAAVGRFDFIFDHNLFYITLDLLIVAGMARDWFVDGRVNKVYWYALPVMFVVQNVAIYLWRANPAWYQALTRTILTW